MAFEAVDKALCGEKLPKKTVVQDKVYDQATAPEAIGSNTKLRAGQFKVSCPATRERHTTY